jgi:hypothetical protein
MTENFSDQTIDALTKETADRMLVLIANACKTLRQQLMAGQDTRATEKRLMLMLATRDSYLQEIGR